MENKNILITGASGNIGTELLRGLKEIGCKHNIVAADYMPENDSSTQQLFDTMPYRRLDFAKPEGFDLALEGIDIVFLLRPPHLADIKKYFYPFVAAMKKHNISKVVFLSVQGAESQSFIPHHKLEKLILAYQMEYVFLRPSYFMQNLTTTLLYDIQKNKRIFMPSGKLRFNWVDARDIGLVGAHVLNDFEAYTNQALEITGSDFAGFGEVARLINQHLQTPITYVSPNLLRFYFAKRKQGIAPAMIFVMIMLHFLPRLGKNQPRLTDVVEKVTGKKSTTLEEFVKREAGKLSQV
ncbi:MAG: NmrA-like family protein [Bacteroidetes bacterium]|nr:MAG: NmrA-like family protein [Bacteroidota bacterium]